MARNIDVFGFDELEKAMKQCEKNYPSQADAFLMAEGRAVNKRTKSLTPVRTKKLRNSWRTKKVKLYKALKQDDKAFAEVQRLIDAHPKDITYLILLGDLYLDSNRDEDAWKVYQHAGEIEPDNAYLMVSKANYYNKKGDKELIRSKFWMLC